MNPSAKHFIQSTPISPLNRHLTCLPKGLCPGSGTLYCETLVSNCAGEGGGGGGGGGQDYSRSSLATRLYSDFTSLYVNACTYTT